MIYSPNTPRQLKYIGKRVEKVLKKSKISPAYKYCRVTSCWLYCMVSLDNYIGVIQLSTIDFFAPSMQKWITKHSEQCIFKLVAKGGEIVKKEST